MEARFDECGQRRKGFIFVFSLHEQFDLASNRRAQQQQIHDSLGVGLCTACIDDFDIRGKIFGGIDQLRSGSSVKPERVNDGQFGVSHNEAGYVARAKSAYCFPNSR